MGNTAEYNRDYRERNRPQLLEKQARYREENRERLREEQRELSKRGYHRNYHLVRTYGITAEQFDRMAYEQGYVCAACGEPEQSKNGHLHVDHDHETGQIRGLLCQRCNTAIGQAGDDPERLVKLSAYLLKCKLS